MQNDNEFRSLSIKIQCIAFGLHEIESAIESTIKTSTELAKQYWHVNPIYRNSVT